MKFKKEKNTILIIMVLIIFLSGINVCAHSGRTDKNGGHRDNKNVSGLGYYHYHCGGHPAHLHTNGVCPYSSTSTQSTIPSTESSSTSSTTSSIQETQKTTSVKEEKYNKTNISTNSSSNDDENGALYGAVITGMIGGGGYLAYKSKKK